MRKVVFGKYVYDTTNATEIYSLPEPTEEYNCNSEDFDYPLALGEYVMQTPEGRLFLLGGGGFCAIEFKTLSLIQGIEYIIKAQDTPENKIRAIEKIVLKNTSVA